MRDAIGFANAQDINQEAIHAVFSGNRCRQLNIIKHLDHPMKIQNFRCYSGATFLEQINCVISKSRIAEELSNTGLNPYDLAHVLDFNSLIAISQQLSKPAFALTDEDIKETGKVFGHAEKTMLTSRDNFSAVFRELGQRVLSLTS